MYIYTSPHSCSLIILISKIHIHDVFILPPHCVGFFVFGSVSRRPPPPPHPPLCHTTWSHTTIFHTHLCHTQSFTHSLTHTHNFVTHNLSHTTLSHNNFVTHNLSHTHTHLLRKFLSNYCCGVHRSCTNNPLKSDR